jgi:acyl carrier protein
MPETMEHTVRQFIIQNFLFGQDDGTLRDEDSFLEKGVIDSTGVLELVAFLEAHYGIHVADEELIPDNLDSIAKLSTFIRIKTSSVESA